MKTHAITARDVMITSRETMMTSRDTLMTSQDTLMTTPAGFVASSKRGMVSPDAGVKCNLCHLVFPDQGKLLMIKIYLIFGIFDLN